MVAELPREPGQSTVRYTHLLVPEDEKPAATPVTPQASLGMADRAPAAPDEAAGDLRRELHEIKAQIAEIEETLREACQRLDRIEGL
jgi:uncharacterized protein YceH (UPF0502 family)